MTEILQKTVYVSWFTSANETKPNYEITVSWLGLVGLLLNPHKRRITTDERTVPLISFARFDGARANENVKALTAVVMNFDGTAKYETIRQLAAEYEFVAYSSHGHASDKPKFRLILLPSREITPAEWPKVQLALNANLGNKADASTRAAAHIIAVPSAPAKRRDAAFAHHNHGRLLDPDLLLSSNASSRPLVSLSSSEFVSIAGNGRSGGRANASAHGYRTQFSRVAGSK